jgi:hypothetical protein
MKLPRVRARQRELLCFANYSRKNMAAVRGRGAEYRRGD